MYPEILDIMYSDIKEGKKNTSGGMSKGTFSLWDNNLRSVLYFLDELQRKLAVIGFLSETEYQQSLDSIYQDFEGALHTLAVWKKDGDI